MAVRQRGPSPPEGLSGVQGDIRSRIAGPETKELIHRDIFGLMMARSQGFHALMHTCLAADIQTEVKQMKHRGKIPRRVSGDIALVPCVPVHLPQACVCLLTPT